MIRAFRAPALGRQPLVTSTTTTATTSPLQRLAAQAWRNTAATTPAPSRSIHAAAGGTRTAGAAAGRSAAGRTTWRATGTTTTTAQDMLARAQRRNFNWSWARRSKTGGAKAEESLSLSARLRKLSREYGWAAAGVYLGLSVLDFPFCFLLVKWAGTDRIAAIEEWILYNVKRFVPDSVKEKWHDWRAAAKGVEKEELGDNHISEDLEKVGWGVEEAQERHKADASLATQLALAYAIHKSFIFIRVPLTAAVTPKVVKVLRSWGWQIGKRKPKTKR